MSAFDACLGGGGGGGAADIIVFTSNDHRLLAIDALHAQNATVLNAAPPDRDYDCEDRDAEDNCHQT